MNINSFIAFLDLNLVEFEQSVFGTVKTLTRTDWEKALDERLFPGLLPILLTCRCSTLIRVQTIRTYWDSNAKVVSKSLITRAGDLRARIRDSFMDEDPCECGGFYSRYMQLRHPLIATTARKNQDLTQFGKIYLPIGKGFGIGFCSKGNCFDDTWKGSNHANWYSAETRFSTVNQPTAA